MNRVAPSGPALAAAAILLLTGAAAPADPISFDFAGTVTASSAGTPAGTPFHGSFSLDPSLPTLDPSVAMPDVPLPDDTSTFTFYGYSDPTQPVPSASFAARFDLGDGPSATFHDPSRGVVLVADGTPADPTVAGSPPVDAFSLSLMQDDSSMLSLNLVDSTAGALSGTGLPGVLDLARFDESIIFVDSPTVGVVFGQITSLTPSTVPEPASLAVLALGALGAWFARRRLRQPS